MTSFIDNNDCDSSIHSDFELVSSDSQLFEEICQISTYDTLHGYPSQPSPFCPSILAKNLWSEKSVEEESTEPVIVNRESCKTIPKQIEDIHLKQLAILKQTLEKTGEQVLELLEQRKNNFQAINELQEKVLRLETKNSNLKKASEQKDRRKTSKHEGPLIKASEKDLSSNDSSVAISKRSSVSSEETKQLNLEAIDDTYEAKNSFFNFFLFIFFLILIAVNIGLQLHANQIETQNEKLRADLSRITNRVSKFEANQKEDLIVSDSRRSASVHKNFDRDIHECQTLSEQNERISLENIQLHNQVTVLATFLLVAILSYTAKFLISFICKTLKSIQNL